MIDCKVQRNSDGTFSPACFLGVGLYAVGRVYMLHAEGPNILSQCMAISYSLCYNGRIQAKSHNMGETMYATLSSLKKQ